MKEEKQIYVSINGRNEKISVEEAKKRLKEGLGHITENCACIKFDEDDNVEYIRIDDQIFNNPETIADDVIAYASKIREAVEKSKAYQNPKQMGKHIDPFIIKYHPAWIYLRTYNGFVIPEENEEICSTTNKIMTYEEWLNYNFIAIGMKPYYNLDVNPKARMDYKIYEKTFKYGNREEEDYANLEHVHEDYIAFDSVAILKEEIDFYKEQINQGINYKDLELSYRNVSYFLGKDGFPLIKIGRGNKKKTYDFRNVKEMIACYNRLADINPGSKYEQWRKKNIIASIEENKAKQKVKK